jgi:uncharacterized protein
VIVFGCGNIFAYDSMNIAPLDNFVVDHTQTLNSSQIESLSSGAYTIQQNTSAQIAALIIPDRWWYELYDIALKVFRDSKLWTKDLNNGLLLIIAKDEKKLRLTVGYGLEWIIPDILARDIVEQIRPFVDNGDIYGALQTYYELVTPYVQWTGKSSINTTKVYTISMRDPIRCVVFFLSMTILARKPKHIKRTSTTTQQKYSINTIGLIIGIIWLLILAKISFTTVAFWFYWWLIWYLFWFFNWYSLYVDNRNSKYRWWFSSWFGGSSRRDSGWSSWWGGGWFSGGFGGSSGWGWAGD